MERCAIKFHWGKKTALRLLLADYYRKWIDWIDMPELFVFCVGSFDNGIDVKLSSWLWEIQKWSYCDLGDFDWFFFGGFSIFN